MFIHDEFESISSIKNRVDNAKFGRGILTFVVGLQFGSEAKGSVVNHLAPVTSIAVRTGAANAGHTIYYEGEPYVSRQLPGAWTNSCTELVIGSGAIISPDVLENEINTIEKYIPIRHRIKIDRNAHIITKEQIVDESKADLAERIGSTSSRNHEGIGRAMADKVLREARCVQAKDYMPFKEYISDTVEYINTELDKGIDVLVEGTQGFGLSIDHGTFPYVTSRNATVSALADSIGIQTNRYMTNIIGVARSFPIRVAGNSGPFASGSRELTWQQMREYTGNSKLEPEKTSVTHLERRIATFSDSQYIEACRVNRPTEICFTFADYLDRSIYKTDRIANNYKVMSFIDHLENLYPDAPVTLVNTGPGFTVDLDDFRRIRLRQVS